MHFLSIFLGVSSLAAVVAVDCWYVRKRIPDMLQDLRGSSTHVRTRFDYMDPFLNITLLPRQFDNEVTQLGGCTVLTGLLKLYTQKMLPKAINLNIRGTNKPLRLLHQKLNSFVAQVSACTFLFPCLYQSKSLQKTVKLTTSLGKYGTVKAIAETDLLLNLVERYIETKWPKHGKCRKGMKNCPNTKYRKQLLSHF